MTFESFIGINPWTALFVLLNFLLLFFVAKKFLFKPVKDMIDSRQSHAELTSQCSIPIINGS